MMATRQITSFVFDVVRAQVPKIKLDDVFEKKDDIANIDDPVLRHAEGDRGLVEVEYDPHSPLARQGRAIERNEGELSIC